MSDMSCCYLFLVLNVLQGMNRRVAMCIIDDR
jgi:hypothetical protein